MRQADTEFNVCVYCGSRRGVAPAYGELADAMGRALARRGWGLVYGGGAIGLMGRVADATLAAGGRAVGVIPDHLRRREVGHMGLSELHVVATMHERKQRMAERCDAFVAMPGGIGTFEEIFEAWTWAHLRHHHRPLALLDLPGKTYWRGLMGFLDHSVAAGFMDTEQTAMLDWHDDVETLLDALWARRDTDRRPLNLI